jgi:hypothetical protein
MKCYQPRNRLGGPMPQCPSNSDNWYTSLDWWHVEQPDSGCRAEGCMHHEFLGEDSFQGWVAKIRQEEVDK